MSVWTISTASGDHNVSISDLPNNRYTVRVDGQMKTRATPRSEGASFDFDGESFTVTPDGGGHWNLEALGAAWSPPPARATAAAAEASSGPSPFAIIGIIAAVVVVIGFAVLRARGGLSMWREYDSKEASFRVEFPSKPLVKRSSQGGIPVTAVGVERSFGEFGVIYFPRPEGMAYDAMAAYRSEFIKAVEGKVVDSDMVKTGRFSGREIRIRVGKTKKDLKEGEIVTMRNFRSTKYIYILIACAEKDHAEMEARFLSSFAIKD
jgi:hypothetical protein